MATATPSTAPGPILSIRDLSVSIEEGPDIRRPVLTGLSLDVPKGQTLALLGESGSGKTLAAYSVLNLLPSVARITSGTIEFNKTNLLTMSPSSLRRIRGNQIGMVYQEPATSLNPLMRIGKQIGETLVNHKGLSLRNAKDQVLSLMELVGIPDPRRRFNNYPHQLSGGVKQRVVIAMALACRPELLLADEPTSALDTTVQAQILDLLSRLIQDLRMSVFLISHDLGVVAALADRVAVLQGGIVVENGPVEEVLRDPAHPYSRALLAARPKPLAVATDATGVSEDGCPYARYCKHAMPGCALAVPWETQISPGRTVRCFLYGGEPIAEN